MVGVCAAAGLCVVAELADGFSVDDDATGVSAVTDVIEDCDGDDISDSTASGVVVAGCADDVGAGESAVTEVMVDDSGAVAIGESAVTDAMVDDSDNVAIGEFAVTDVVGCCTGESNDDDAMTDVERSLGWERLAEVVMSARTVEEEEVLVSLSYCLSAMMLTEIEVFVPSLPFWYCLLSMSEVEAFVPFWYCLLANPLSMEARGACCEWPR